MIPVLLPADWRIVLPLRQRCEPQYCLVRPQQRGGQPADDHPAVGRPDGHPHTRQETLPNVPLDRIGIYVAWPQATPESVEALVCTPVETAIDDVEGGTELISEAREGLCSVQLDVLKGHDTRAVLEQIRTRLEALDTLPGDAERPGCRN